MKIQRGYKTEIDPNNKQKTNLFKHAGAARFTYNWGLKQKQAAMKIKAKIPNAIELHRQLNELKPIDFPWMYEVSKCSPQEALRNLDNAFGHFFRKCKLKKQKKFKGKVGFPVPKTKKKSIGSFRLTGTIKVTKNSIQLPRLGKLRLKEKGYLPTNAKILSANVSEQSGRWFVSVQVEEERSGHQEQKHTHDIVGVDLGIKTLATVSNGEIFENPKALKKNLRKLRRCNRSLHRKKKGGKNRKKVRNKLSKLHLRIANIRKDTLHNITTTLAKTKRIVGIEDLNVSGMMKNHKLARSIADCGFYEFKRQLIYKGEKYDCKIVLVDRYFPSSKMCSNCGKLNKELALADREWTCEGCGVHHDRDFNASVNIEKEAMRIVAASSSETINACEVSKLWLRSNVLSETNSCAAGMKQEVISG